MANNYPLHLRKLKKFAKICGLRLVFRTCEDGGWYNPNKREIVIDRRLGEFARLSTILHELGHFVDDQRNPTRLSNIWHYQGRSKIETSDVLTANQKESVWTTEIAAWKNAEAIARMLKIKLGKWYWKDKSASLNTYRPMRTE